MQVTADLCKIEHVGYIAGSPSYDWYKPHAGVLELAVMGRTNVGKSSLLNMITGMHTFLHISI